MGVACIKKINKMPSIKKAGYAVFMLSAFAYAGQLWANTPDGAGALSINFNDFTGESSLVPALKIVVVLTILSVAPAILLMMTSFTRILIVLGFIRLALGTQSMPPNQVVVGLAMFLTFFTMQPVWENIDKNALTPYMSHTIEHEEAIKNALKPVQGFMLKQTRDNDLKIFYEMNQTPPPDRPDDIPITTLIPAFMLSELKTAFEIGFLIYVPFLVVDMVISSILMAMGMMMLPPTVVSLPFKLVLFILVDGWNLLIESLVKSFQV